MTDSGRNAQRIQPFIMDSGIRIITRDPDGGAGWRIWRHPVCVLQADRIDDIIPLLQTIDEKSNHGLHALGFVTYEAGRACDPSFKAHATPCPLPLAWFALFESSDPLPELPETSNQPSVKWHTSETRASYRKIISELKNHIAAGDTYQVNYTFPLHSTGSIDPAEFLFMLYRAQPTPYAMLIDTPAFQIMSASPELFFRLNGEQLVCEPMKGTSPRGLHPELDDVIGTELQNSTKNRAENVMIVDMVRNDISRIAATGTVKVEELFKVTKWPTLWQMTSCVTAQTSANLPELFSALFPSASITGAPKLKTSEIIARLENSPRGVYTGAIGWWFPHRRAQFAVAIRTAVHLPADRTTTYGVGSGIVWDSDADDEYRECLLKSRILQGDPSRFRLLETLRWDQSGGYVLLDEHLLRIEGSATYFGFACDTKIIRSKLEHAARKFDTVHRRVRLLLSKNGGITIQHQELTTHGHYDDPSTAPAMTGCLDTHRIHLNSAFLFHKTTRRRMYEQAKRRSPHVDEVLLVNSRGELMEFTAGNLVINRDGQWLTPGIESGLLPGVFRDHLITRGEIQPARLTIADVNSNNGIYFINSVRGWRKVEFPA